MSALFRAAGILLMAASGVMVVAALLLLTGVLMLGNLLQ